MFEAHIAASQCELLKTFLTLKFCCAPPFRGCTILFSENILDIDRVILDMGLEPSERMTCPKRAPSKLFRLSHARPWIKRRFAQPVGHRGGWDQETFKGEQLGCIASLS